MKKISEILKEVEALERQLHSKGIHQYTIDLIEKVEERLYEHDMGESGVDDATELGSIAYRMDCLLEIVSKDTEDYLIYQQLQKIIEEGRKP